MFSADINNRFYKLQAAVTFMVTLLVSSPVVAEVDFNGFGSLVTGRVTEGNEFLSDYPKTGVYDKDWSFSPDSTLGLQFSSDVSDSFSLVAQVVVHSAADTDADVDWLYLNYHISSELSAQFGRKRLPLYYYSDYFDVGYAYYWVRPPADLYTWQITNYNGISLLYETSIGDWDTSASLYYGNEDSDDNELLGLLFGVPVDEYWKDMFGIVGTMASEWLDMRLTFMQGMVVRNINGVRVINDVVQRFIGLSVNIMMDDLHILSEFNNYDRPDNDINVDTYMVSVAYQLGNFAPYISYSAFEQEINAAGNDEKHHTNSIGIRWDFHTDMAFKLQYDEVIDEGILIPIKGDSQSITFGLDFVF